MINQSSWGSDILLGSSDRASSDGEFAAPASALGRRQLAAGPGGVSGDAGEPHGATRLLNRKQSESYTKMIGTTEWAAKAREWKLSWTAEKIAAFTTDQVKALRANAAKRNVQDTVDLCEAELARRRRLRTKQANSYKQTHIGETVHGFHFVCPTEKGITRNQDGTIWTGTWVVDKNHAERAAKIGAYVALHVAKCQPSYLQGTVRDWRIREREPTYADGQLVKMKFGVDFLIELTDQPLEWQGDGSGEKGYFYGEHSDSDARAPGELRNTPRA